MHETRIGAVGLSLQDRIVLRSTLRFLNERSQGGRRWTYVEDGPRADVVFVLRASSPERGGAEVMQHAESAWPLRIVVVQQQALLSPDESGLVLPLRGRELAAALAVVSGRLDRLAVQGRSPAQAAIRAAGVVDTLGMLHSGRALAGQLPVTLHVGDLALAIQQDALRPIPQGLIWGCSEPRGLQAICRLVREGASIRLTFGADNLGIASSKGSLQQLTWALAAYEPDPKLVQAVGSMTRLALIRWPDFGSLPATPSQVHMAALLARHRLTIAELIASSRVTQSEAVAVVNACHWLRLISIDGDPVAKVTDAAGRDPARRMSLKATGVDALISSIRSALREAARRVSR